MLGRLLLHDIERKGGDGDDGVSLKDGVSKDRMVPVHDPGMRHGHQGGRGRFDGNRASIVVDTGARPITAVAVLPGNAPDNLGATSSSTWRRAVAPVRRGRSPATSCQRDGVRMPPVGSTPRGPSSSTGPPVRRIHPLRAFQFDGSASSTGQNVRPVHCGPSASRPKAGRDSGCGSIPKKPCCGRPGHCNRAPGMTISSAAGGGGTPVGPAGPFGHPPVPLFRTRQAEIPAVPGCHGGHPSGIHLPGKGFPAGFPAPVSAPLSVKSLDSVLRVRLPANIGPVP